MDISAVLTPLFSYLKLIIPIAILFAFLKSSWFKGKLGEFIVRKALERHFSTNQYYLFNNLTFSINEETTQVDHIIVSIYGVFVIETKNFKGWIFGTEKQKMWTQKIYRHSYKFQNPIHQNYKHIKILSELSDLDEGYFHSIIIFSKEAQFKTQLPSYVTYLDDAIPYIESYSNQVLSNKQVADLRHDIDKCSLQKGLITDYKHIKNLEQTHRHYNEKKRCPKCGSQLVLRTSKRGVKAGEPFLGCSNFPSCRFTRNI